MNSNKFKKGFCSGGDFKQLGPFKAVDASFMNSSGHQGTSAPAHLFIGSINVIVGNKILSDISHSWLHDNLSNNFKENFRDNSENFKDNFKENNINKGDASKGGEIKVESK